ncbi:MAG: hypothetical protein OEM52_10820 [bacterium]|nr:hypothetical protein [bacterium]
MRTIYIILLITILTGFVLAKEKVSVPVDTSKATEAVTPVPTIESAPVKLSAPAPEKVKQSVTISPTPVEKPIQPADQVITPRPITTPTPGNATTISPERGTKIATPTTPDAAIKESQKEVKQTKQKVSVPDKSGNATGNSGTTRYSGSRHMRGSSYTIVNYSETLVLDSMDYALRGIDKFILNVPAYTPNAGDSILFREEIETSLYTNGIDFIRFPTNWEKETTPRLTILVDKIMGFSNSSDSIMQIRIEVNQDVRPIVEGSLLSDKTLVDVPIWHIESYLLVSRFDAYNDIQNRVLASLQVFIARYKAANDSRVDFKWLPR